MSGSIEAATLVGDQKYRTVSGELTLWSLGGLVDAGSVSGSITLDRGGDVRLRANSVSGRIRARARRFHGLTVSTTSGGIAVVGEFDPSGDYRAESISGTVDLTPLSGVTAELRAITGSIVSQVDNRVEGSRGYWRSIVGDGRSTFKVNTTSGNLRILAALPGDTVGADAPAPTPAGTDAAPSRTEPTDADAVLADTDRQVAGETWNPDEGSATPDEAATDEELAVLQALERGEIDVDEAAERLDRARH
jgi:hypothetical protein